MPPENEPVVTAMNETLGNSAEARNPDGSLKNAPTPEVKDPPKDPPKDGAKPGETTSTDPSKKEPENKEPPKEPPKAPENIATGAPETYKFENLPDGMEVTEKALTFFKDNQMSQAQADRAVAFYKELVEEVANGPMKYWEDMNKTWIKAVEADPEYKGNIPAMRGSIAKFIDGVQDAKLAGEFREAMDSTGAGNNPAFVKFMFRMAEAFNEGGFVKPGGPSRFGQLAPGTNERPSAAKALFPNLK